MYGIIQLINDNPEDEFPIEVIFEDGSKEFYTKIGRKYKEGTVMLRKIRVVYGKYTHPTVKPREPAGFLKDKKNRSRDSGDSESSNKD
jgi:hypothetical protein